MSQFQTNCNLRNVFQFDCLSVPMKVIKHVYERVEWRSTFQVLCVLCLVSGPSVILMDKWYKYKRVKLMQHMSGRVEWSMTRSTLQVLRKQRLLSLRQFPCASGKRELGQANCKPMWYCIEVFMYTAQSQCVISVRSGKLQAKWMPNWYCVPGRANCCKKYGEGEDMLPLQLPSSGASFLVFFCQNNAIKGQWLEPKIDPVQINKSSKQMPQSRSHLSFTN